MNFSSNFTTLMAAYEAGKARGSYEYFVSPTGEIFVKNAHSPGGLLFRRGNPRPQCWAAMPDNFVPFDMVGAQDLLWEGLKPWPVYLDEESGPCFNRPGLPLATREDVVNVPCDVASIWEALPPGEILVLADGVFQISESGVLEEI